MPRYGKEGYLTDLSLQDTELFDAPLVTEEERHRARLTVCDHTQDATVARQLLDVLGLLP